MSEVPRSRGNFSANSTFITISQHNPKGFCGSSWRIATYRIDDFQKKKFTNTSKEDITKCVKKAGENETDGKIDRKMLQKIMK